ncbi:hypothetical protein ABF87_00475 [Nitrosomonas sp. JL21]|uniref:hypothetical protein n=1 Tax=Nitrosomonas sp. JL21 TaxID=153949 RepID=UPI00136D4955|nr:hypothetical protein [Nitrosomonas sp. JL21]MBL8496635.1 hypothetical protein [Nitrosomonas sp.]MXS76450.1 hypothetical protein [Nitrosomonas sp. JL21]
MKYKDSPANRQYGKFENHPVCWIIRQRIKTASVSILASTLMLLATYSVAFAQQTVDLKNMTCRIRSAETDKCSALPTVQSGLLTMAKEGTFRLQAQYQSCFMTEQATRSGRFRALHVDKTLRLELLTIQATGTESVATDFPRTLGIVNLNDATLEGYWVDFSATIRGQGRHAEKIAPAELQCDIDE